MRVLFAGRSNGAVCWYRCALPAMALGHDWVGIVGDPPSPLIATGLTREPVTLERFAGYDVVVLQLARGPAWLKVIRDLRRAGVTVLYEVDDDLRGIRHNRSHDFRDRWDLDTVREYELCMRAADGVIGSTAWLASRYRSVNPRTWVCRNGLDVRRYALTRPGRDQVAIGWAGATGHRDAALPWIDQVGDVMAGHPASRFISIGQPFAERLVPRHGRGRCLSVPFAPLESYPATMALLDVALAPAGTGTFFKGKSDLRWLEASALGIPLVADPVVYPDIEHGVTGFHASTPAEMREHLEALVADEALRRRVGEAARAHVLEHRRIEVAARRWAEVLEEARAGREARAA